MSEQKIQIRHQGKIIATDISVADNFWLRLSGYMFRKQPHVAGILFEPSGSIQTSFMSFAVDVVFMTQEKHVSKVVSCAEAQPNNAMTEIEKINNLSRDIGWLL